MMLLKSIDILGLRRLLRLIPLREAEHHTPGDIHTSADTDNTDEIQAAPDTHVPDTPGPNNAVRTDTVSGSSSGMDLSVTSIPLQYQHKQVLSPHFRSTSTVQSMLCLLLLPCTTSRSRPP